MFKLKSFLIFLLNTYASCKSEGGDNALLRHDKSIYSAQRCLLVNCSITCRSRSYETLEEDLAYTLNFNSYCNQIQFLTLINYTFKNGVLPKHFLGTFQNSVLSLTLEDCNIKEIESGAFANASFKEINFTNLQLKELRTEFFKDINNAFESLMIHQCNDVLHTIEEDFFCELSDKLNVLRFHMGLKQLHQYFKCTNFRQLISLNLKGNNFGNRLKFDTFITFTNIKYLNLSYCKINFLPSYIFSYIMDTIIYLDLSHNRLKSYWSMMFGYLRIPTVASVNLLNNQFVCSCNLFETWYSMSTQIADIDCLLPENKSIKRKVSASLCTFFDKEIVPKNVSQLEFEKSYCENLYNSTTKHEYSSLAFQLLRLDTSLEVNSTRVIVPTNIDVIAFRHNEMKIIPLQDLLNGSGLDEFELKKDMPYTLCVVSHERKQLETPFNCRSITIHSKKESWLLSKYSGFILATIILGSLVCICIGFMTACSIIKRRPTLIRGSKRIIKQHLHSDGVIVLPKRCSKKVLLQKEQEIAEMKRSALNQSMLAESTSLQSSLSDNYIIDNIYEAVPAYMKLRDQPPEPETTTLIDTEENYNWMYSSTEFPPDESHVVKSILKNPGNNLPTVIISEHTDKVDLENNTNNYI